MSRVGNILVKRESQRTLRGGLVGTRALEGGLVIKSIQSHDECINIIMWSEAVWKYLLVVVWFTNRDAISLMIFSVRNRPFTTSGCHTCLVYQSIQCSLERERRSEIFNVDGRIHCQNLFPHLDGHSFTFWKPINGVPLVTLSESKYLHTYI